MKKQYLKPASKEILLMPGILLVEASDYSSDRMTSRRMHDDNYWDDEEEVEDLHGWFQ